MDFVAFDFETANSRPTSACALGLVRVSGGEIVSSSSRLIRPVPFYFSPFNISIHGIRPEDVIAEPEFDQIWPLLSDYFNGRTLIAHNSPFDIGILGNLLRYFDLPRPELNCLCTVRIARRVWPGRPSYRLSSIARELGISFRHHDALEDARAAAEIARLACERTGCAELEELAERLGLSARGLD